jgi:DNA-binding NtrC family response regulator
MVIEEHAFRRLGGTAEMRSEARVVCATHQPLAAAVEARRFRADLFYRLQVLTIELPPLRERAGEIPALARSLLPRGARLSEAGVRALLRYPWPGNIRELKNALWRATIIADGAEIGPQHLALPSATTAAAAASTPPAGVPTTLADAERRAILAALSATSGNKLRAAQLLDIARSTLAEKLKRYGIGD